MSRKLFLRTDPPGAIVYLDGQRAGVTPYEGDIPAYGTRRVEFDLAGYRRSVQELELPWPWWQYVPLDVVTDLLVPWTIEDHRSFSFTLEPVDPEQGTWDDAHAALQRMKDFKAATGTGEAPPPEAQPEPAPEPAPAPAGGGA